MQRRGASGQPVKGRHTTRPKARKAPTAHASTDRSPEQFDRLKRERDEALEQLAATSEVLQVISSTPGDLEPVFQSMLANAVRICEAKFGTLYRTEGDAVRCVAMHGVPKAFAEERRRVPVIRPAPTSTLGRALATKRPVQIADVRDEPQYPDTPSGYTGGTLARLAGARTVLSVPMLKDAELIGAIIIYRQEVGSFTDKQIELVKGFAAQAVIAIENTRLLNELRGSLQQQTATADVLKVISSSPGDMKPVFEAMLANALHICDAKFGHILLYDGERYHAAYLHEVPSSYREFWEQHGPIRPSPSSGLARLARTKQISHIPDLKADAAYAERDPLRVVTVEQAGARSLLAVPMLKENELIGAIIIYRQELRPFTDKQIELVKNFAAQAVIAIENTRLLNELRESLQQQTATADVLKVISSSPGELEPVFKTMLAKAVELCEANFGAMWLVDGEGYRTAAMYGDLPRSYVEQWRSGTLHLPKADIPMVRAIRSRKAVHTSDMREEKAYLEGDPLAVSAADIGGIRTLVTVPMLKEGEAVGAIAIYRQEVRLFTEKQIELVKNFAAQAVIAIENTRLLNELRQRTDDLSESLEQQTATSEVLKVISSSPGDLQPVFDAILANATDLCDARFATLRLSEGDQLRTVNLYNAPAALVEHWRSTPLVRPHPESALGRAALTKQAVQIEDVKKGPAYSKGDPLVVAGADLGGYRTVLAVPMLKEDGLIGVISIYHQEVRPFTDKQIELVKNFAAQAVIAIENARLLSELRESLQRQTATADVLKVISSSPGDLAPVFKAMLENAVHICEAKFGHMFLSEGEAFRVVALESGTLPYPDWLREGSKLELRVNPRGPLARIATTGKIVHIGDLTAETPYIERNPRMVALVESSGARTFLGVPMFKGKTLMGAIGIYRQEVRPFTDKQIELVQNFASQAVIAIENARLLNELRQRTDDLTESLEQQTATSEILEVISNSPTDTQPVFDAIVRSGLNLFPEAVVAISLPDHDLVKLAAIGGADEAGLQALRRRYPMPLSHEFITGTAILDRHEIDLADAHEPPKELTVGAQNLLAGGYRAMTVMPMMRGDETIGALNVIRRYPGPLSDKQRELLRTFANQAVIAIENTRLFNELRESLQQQTATADVLKVISRSTFDLQTVLQTLVESAGRLCEADKATITRQKDRLFYLTEGYGCSREFMDYIRNVPIRPERGSAAGRSLLEGRVVHISDVKADPDYTFVEAQRLGDYRTILCVPMLRESIPIGVVALMRSEVRPFTDKQIELVATFADQAAIAIENVRLFESVEARTRELGKSLEDLRTTQDRLVQTQKLASLGQLTAGIAHEIKNPLNFVNNFSGISAELITELQEALADVSLNEKRQSEITELMDTLRGNLDKVVQHGKRADAIVKNMLLHSREGSGEHRVVDINALVEESLNLAYHGARAEKQGFNITMERSLDPAAGEADVFPQDVTRVLLNLISNGFYAATKRKAQADGDGYEPTLVALDTEPWGPC